MSNTPVVVRCWRNVCSFLQIEIRIVIKNPITFFLFFKKRQKIKKSYMKTAYQDIRCVGYYFWPIFRNKMNSPLIDKSSIWICIIHMWTVETEVGEATASKYRQMWWSRFWLYRNWWRTGILLNSFDSKLCS